MDWLKNRALEPSTWRGLGWLLVAVGVLPVEAVEGIAALGVAVVGLVELVRKEK